MTFLVIAELEEEEMETVMGDITKEVDEAKVVTVTTPAMTHTEEAITMEEATKEIIQEKEVIVDTNTQTLTALNT
jgi:hypothetical protein